jgi:hypothetical protein
MQFSDAFAFLLKDVTGRIKSKSCSDSNTNIPVSVETIRDNTYNVLLQIQLLLAIQL